MAKQSGQQQKTLGGFYKVVIHNVEVAPTAYPVKEINCHLIFSPCVNSPQLSFINMVQSHAWAWLHVLMCFMSLLTHARRIITPQVFFFSRWTLGMGDIFVYI